MILAVGLTPAWQQILVFDRLEVGHVNRAHSTLWCGSGKVLNVGAALHHLKADSLTLSPVGGMTGDQIRADFRQRGIEAHWIPTVTATRVCTTLLDTGRQITTELVENSTAMSSHELEQFEKSFSQLIPKASLIVLTGSLPQGSPSDFYRRLIARSRVPAILDVRGRELIECLPLRPLLVKPNREELAATVGRPLSSEEDVIQAISHVRELGAEWVVVSNGPEPLLVMGPDGLHRIEPPRVQVVNPIGCGDSLTAAIASRIAINESPLDSIRFGIEYATRKAGVLFPVLTTALQFA